MARQGPALAHGILQRDSVWDGPISQTRKLSNRTQKSHSRPESMPEPAISSESSDADQGCCPPTLPSCRPLVLWPHPDPASPGECSRSRGRGCEWHPVLPGPPQEPDALGLGHAVAVLVSIVFAARGHALVFPALRGPHKESLPRPGQASMRWSQTSSMSTIRMKTGFWRSPEENLSTSRFKWIMKYHLINDKIQLPIDSPRAS